MSSGGLSGLFLFQGNRYGRIRRQPHVLPFDIRDQPQIYEMMMALVMSFAAVGFRKLDPAVFNAIDGSDINAVRPDHPHMLLYDCPGSGWRLRSNELVALPGQEFELRLLVGDTLRVQVLDRGAGIGRCLLLQFEEVLPYGTDACFNLSEIKQA